MKLFLLLGISFYSISAFSCDCSRGFDPKRIVESSTLLMEGKVVHKSESRIVVEMKKIYQNKLDKNVTLTNPWQLNKNAIYIFDGSEFVGSDCAVSSERMDELGDDILFVANISKREDGKLMIAADAKLYSCVLGMGYVSSMKSHYAEKILSLLPL